MMGHHGTVCVFAVIAVFCIGLSTGACPPNCVSCGQNSPDSCDGCVAGYVIVGPPTGYYCAGCAVGCTNGCSLKGAGKCDPCSTAGCISPCNSTYGYNSVNFTCNKCDPNCQGGCVTKGAGKCDQTCKTGYTLVNFQCVIVCDTNCASGCTTTGPYNCDSKCNAGYLLYNSKCVKCDPNCLNVTGCSVKGPNKCDVACKTSFSLFTGNYTCVACDANCLNLSNGCVNSGAGKCDATCASGYGLDASTKRCFASVNGNWTNWSAYTACTVNSTGIWTKNRTRTCTNPAPNYGGAPCSGDAIEIVVCPPVDGNWTNWGPLTACADAGGNVWKQNHTRTCTNPTPQYGGAPCVGDALEVLVCPAVNGNWTDWGPLTTCADAGNNVWKQNHTRTCTNPAPLYGGLPCPGSDVEVLVCPPVNGNWTDWSPFTACADLGGGVWKKNHTRTCTNPAPLYGGLPCPGSNLEVVVCPPVNGNWTDWGPLTSCADAGNNVWQQNHTRTCTNPAPLYGGLPCPGSNLEVLVCPPVNGNWTDWGPLTTCADAGNNVWKQNHTRTCTNPAPLYGGLPCPGSNLEVLVCPPVNGNWTDWGPLTDCADVGGGVWKHNHTRTCTNPAPLYGGLPCPGSDLEVLVCPPVNGNWTDWGPLTSCADAGNNVWQQNHTRTCTNPAPLYGGLPCPGSNLEVLVCPPVNGNWTDWSPFTACADVGGGVWKQSHTRTCTNPAPLYGGLTCAGVDSESIVCPPVNGNWTDWSPFTACADVGGGVWKQSHTRTCTNPAPLYGGLTCAGVDSETIVCPAVAGNWTNWAPIAPCAAGQTTVTYTRSCTNPTPQYGGAPCSGSDTETRTCPKCDPHCVSDCVNKGDYKCDSLCEKGYGLDSTTFTCGACQSTCNGTCDVRGPGSCDGPCISGYGLTTTNLCSTCAVRCTSGCSVKGAGKCDSSCQTGFALSTTDYTCQPCDPSCISGCTVPYKCSSTCAAGYVLDSATSNCLPCDAKCEKTVGSCNVRGPKKCDKTCVNLYALTSSFTCQACNAQCAFKCTTNGPGYCDSCTTTGCASCKANYALKAVMVNNVKKFSCFPCAPLCSSGCVKEGPDCCDSSCQLSVPWVAKNATCHICGNPPLT